jgi:hypothetical protein
MFLTPQDVVAYIEIYKLKIQDKQNKMPMRFGPGGPANKEEEILLNELYDLKHKLNELLKLAVNLAI